MMRESHQPVSTELLPDAQIHLMKCLKALRQFQESLLVARELDLSGLLLAHARG